jgi:hypothetical protein
MKDLEVRVTVQCSPGYFPDAAGTCEAAPKIDLSSDSVTCETKDINGNNVDDTTCHAAIKNDGNPTDPATSADCVVADRAPSFAWMYFQLDLGSPHIVTSVRVTTNAQADTGFFPKLRMTVCTSADSCDTVISEWLDTATVTVIDDNTHEYTFPGVVGQIIRLQHRNSKLYLCDFQVSGKA